MRILLCMMVILAVPSLADEFYLKLDSTGKRYGPFTFEQGGKVTLGRATFSLDIEESQPRKAATPQTDAERSAVRAAEVWLLTIDGNAYGPAWRQLAGYARGTLSEDEFVESIERVRSSLGKVYARQLESIQRVRSMPSAPDGDYVVLRYKATMEQKQAAEEVVIPMLDEDGVWRVSGYTVR